CTPHQCRFRNNSVAITLKRPSNAETHTRPIEVRSIINCRAHANGSVGDINSRVYFNNLSWNFGISARPWLNNEFRALLEQLNGSFRCIEVDIELLALINRGNQGLSGNAVASFYVGDTNNTIEWSAYLAVFIGDLCFTHCYL